MSAPWLEFPTFDAHGNVLVVVETPKGSPFKIHLDPKLGVFTYQRQLRGLCYPHDWGFIPHTRAEDGDPLDALILHDEATWPGVVIPSVPLMVLKIRERKHAQAPAHDNHRILLAPADSECSKPDAARLRQLEEFFLAVGRLTKDVWSEGWGNAEEAQSLIVKSVQ